MLRQRAYGRNAAKFEAPQDDDVRRADFQV
jgi:hypothetical protein